MLTLAEQARMRGRWRALAAAGLAGDAAAIEDAREWPSPVEDRATSFALFGLARWAHAYRKAGPGFRPRLAPALKAMALFVLDTFDAPEADPVPDPGPPRQASLPYRDD